MSTVLRLIMNIDDKYQRQVKCKNMLSEDCSGLKELCLRYCKVTIVYNYVDDFI